MPLMQCGDGAERCIDCYAKWLDAQQERADASIDGLPDVVAMLRADAKSRQRTDPVGAGHLNLAADIIARSA